jgi:hypothetical protein
MKATTVSINRRNDNKNVVYMNNGILFRLFKKMEILSFGITWVNLEDIMLSKPVIERQMVYNLTYL